MKKPLGERLNYRFGYTISSHKTRQAVGEIQICVTGLKNADEKMIPS